MSAAADQPKQSTPNLQKLGGMGSRTLSVTKLLSRTGNGMPLIVGKPRVTIEEITALHSTLPQDPKAGPGTYLFEVFDETGPEKDVWTARLGNDTEGFMQPSETAAATVVAALGAPGAMGGTTSARAIGGGYLYDAELGVLITPQKQIFKWNPSEPLPGSLPGGPATAFAGLPPGATAAYPAWGTMPVGAPAVSETEAMLRREMSEMQRRLEASQAEAKETAREASRKEELAVLRAAMDKQAEDTTKRFETLLAKLTEKPVGPSEEVVLLRQQLEEQKRSQETDRRETALRAEMKASADRFETVIRELKDAKPDQTMPLITQLMSTQQNSLQSIVGAMQSIATMQAKSAEDGMRALAERFGASTLTPERTLELIKASKDRTPEAAATQGMIDMFKSTFGMAQDVVRMQGELYSAQQGPAWVGIAQQAADQIGTVAKAVLMKKAEADGAVQVAKHEAERAQAEARAAAEMRAAATERRAPGVTMGAAPAGGGAQGAVAAAVPPRELTAAEQRAALAEKVFPGASRVAAGANGNAGTPTPAPVPPVVPAAPAAAKKRRGGAAAAVSAPISAAEAEQRLRAMAPDELRAAINAEFDTDEKFFGEATSQIAGLRTGAASGMPPAKAADGILMAKDYFRAFGAQPPCLEVFNAGHLDIVMERIFPDDHMKSYRNAVADSIRVKLRMEPGGGENGEGEEDQPQADA